MNWPDEWEDLILRGNMVLVVGAGKSGLTNLCNLLGSLKPAYYIYGNTILKALPPGMASMYPIIRSIFLYDYVLPYVRGIRGCEIPCAIEDRLLWSRLPEERLNKLCMNLDSMATLTYAARNKALYVTDILDGCVRASEYLKIFPGCQIIQIIRNGFDVISARHFLSWDNPIAYRYPAGPTVDWLEDGRPWFAEESWDNNWNRETKIAHLWRVQVDSLASGAFVFYEQMMAYPRRCVGNLLGAFPMLERTSATDIAINQIKNIKHASKSTVTLNDIREPERAKFKLTMERMGYL